MTESEIIALLDDATAMALTAWAEARGDVREGESSVEERIAVMCVIRNRARHSGASYKHECLRPAQFSCWNVGTDANHLALLAVAETLLTSHLAGPVDSLLWETLYLAHGVISGVLLDRTNGATHYYAPAAMVPVGRVPESAVGKTLKRIGSQLFYQA